MRQDLMEILNGLRPEVDFENAEDLISAGILDSFDIVSLIGEINDTFDVEVDFEDMTPENFNSVDAMEKLIIRLQEED